MNGRRRLWCGDRAGVSIEGELGVVAALGRTSAKSDKRQSRGEHPRAGGNGVERSYQNWTILASCGVRLLGGMVDVCCSFAFIYLLFFLIRIIFNYIYKKIKI